MALGNWGATETWPLPPSTGERTGKREIATKSNEPKEKGITDQEMSRNQTWKPGRPSYAVTNSNYHCLNAYYMPGTTLSNPYTFIFTLVPLVS